MKTILLVDDEYAIMEILAMLLSDEGYEVLTASDGHRALEMLREKHPDLVITDQMMPLLSGADFLRAMMKDRVLRRIPVVLMSSVAPTAANARLPWAMVLRKPFDFRELLDWLRKQRLPGKARKRKQGTT